METRYERAIVIVLALAMAGFAVCASAANAGAAHPVQAVWPTIATGARGAIPRYAYVVGCDGIIDKVDTVGNSPVHSVDVGQQLPIEHNQFHRGTFDSCLTGHALYVPAESAFYAIVPDRYSDPEYVFAFRFSLPELTWQKAFAAGEFDGDGYTALALSPEKQVRVATPNDLLPTFFDPVTYKTHVSLTESPAPLLSIIERSGDMLLLWKPVPDGTRIFSVANMRAKSVTQLELPAGADGDAIHLVPGGTRVYAEEARRIPGRRGEGESWQKTGRAQLYDSATGKLIRNFVDRRIATMTLQAISPSGKAIYGNGRHYFLLDIGGPFANRAVETGPTAHVNSVFFMEQ